MAKCAKCVTPILNAEESISCSECKSLLHCQCTRLKTVDCLKKLTVRKKTSWKCDACDSGELPSPIDPSPQTVTSDHILDSINALHKDLTKQISQVNSNVDIMSGRVEAVNEIVSSVKVSVEVLMEENNLRKTEVTALKQEISQLREELEVSKMEMASAQQYSRMENIEVVGVPFKKGEDVFAILNKIADVMGIKFSIWDFSVAHRLAVTPRRPNPNIIVKFIARTTKQAWMSAYHQGGRTLTGASLSDVWPSHRIYLNDHLAPANKKLLGEARMLLREKKIAGAWSREGKIFVKKTVDPNDKPVHLKSLNDLKRLMDS